MKNRREIERRPGALSPAAQSEAEPCRLFLRPPSQTARERAHPSCSVKMLKDKPAFYVPVKVAHPSLLTFRASLVRRDICAGSPDPDLECDRQRCKVSERKLTRGCPRSAPCAHGEGSFRETTITIIESLCHLCGSVGIVLLNAANNVVEILRRVRCPPREHYGRR